MSEVIQGYRYQELVSITPGSNNKPGKEKRNLHQMLAEIIWLPTSHAISLIVFTLPGAPPGEGHLKSIFGLCRSDYVPFQQSDQLLNICSTCSGTVELFITATGFSGNLLFVKKIQGNFLV